MGLITAYLHKRLVGPTDEEMESDLMHSWEVELILTALFPRIIDGFKTAWGPLKRPSEGGNTYILPEGGTIELTIIRQGS
jgi:hypothetical protein